MPMLTFSRISGVVLFGLAACLPGSRIGAFEATEGGAHTHEAEDVQQRRNVLRRTAQQESDERTRPGRHQRLETRQTEESVSGSAFAAFLVALAAVRTPSPTELPTP